jgi:hypothetical protein
VGKLTGRRRRRGGARGPTANGLRRGREERGGRRRVWFEREDGRGANFALVWFVGGGFLGREGDGGPRSWAGSLRNTWAEAGDGMDPCSRDGPSRVAVRTHVDA